MTCLLHVDTLPTCVGSSEDLHSPLVKVQGGVVGDKRRHTQFLQRVSVEQGLSHSATQHTQSSPHPTPPSHKKQSLMSDTHSTAVRVGVVTGEPQAHMA